MFDEKVNWDYLEKVINTKKKDDDRRRYIYRTTLYHIAKTVRDYNDCHAMVEFGVAQGAGCELMTSAIPKAWYLGIDNKISDSMISKLQSNENVTIIRSDSKSVVITCDRPVKFVYVDGDHSYDGCMNDLKIADEVLTDDGVILIHDTHRDSVHRAFEDWIDTHNYGFREFNVMWCVAWKI